MTKFFKVLDINKLTVGHQERQLFPSFSDSVKEGELISVVGKNGTGKSTLLLTLAGLLPSISGEIEIAGVALRELNGEEVAKRIAYVSTEKIRAGNMKVADLISLGRYPYTGWFGKLTGTDYKIICQSLEKVGILNLAGRNISELSDGERQKATIARAIAQETKILIMDEPTAFLDISARYSVISLMRELTKSGKTVIFSTHDLNIAIEHSDKIWLITENGVASGAPEDLMLSDSFSPLFKPEKVVFNSSGYKVEYQNITNSLIHVDGEGLLSEFTEMALKRAGYDTTITKTDPYIRIDNGQSFCWYIEYQGISRQHSTIYSLIDDLKSFRL